MKFDLPQDAELASKVIDATTLENSKKMERGAIGAVFGSSTEKAGNIAAFCLCIFCIMFISVLVFSIDTPSLSKKDALILVGGFITTTLGFVFGRATS